MERVTLFALYGMWGVHVTPTLVFVLISFHWHQNDFDIDESLRFLMRKKIVYIKVQFSKIEVVKDCFKRNEIWSKLQEKGKKYISEKAFPAIFRNELYGLHILRTVHNPEFQFAESDSRNVILDFLRMSLLLRGIDDRSNRHKIDDRSSPW